MQSTKTPCGITLECLYEKIQSLQKNAFMTARKKFLAARMIQKTYRGYRVRKSVEICYQKAVCIQKNFRAYKARKEFYVMLENRLQEQFMKHYNGSATIIQKWFRGYYSRKYVHDYWKLREKQRETAKELILCVAHKLHHLLRTRQIPGIYSLRNSHCLSKVEELLASLRFKNYNEQVRLERCANKQKMVSVAPSRKNGTVKVNIPFGSRCQEIYKKYSTQQLHQTLDQVAEKKQKSISPKKGPISNIIRPEDGVYVRIVSSMDRCNIVKFDDLSVCPNVLHRPEKIEQFCSEMMQICHSEHFFL